jgi:hypothetical protein
LVISDTAPQRGHVYDRFIETAIVWTCFDQDQYSFAKKEYKGL